MGILRGAADLQAGAPEPVEEDEGVDADAVGFLGALEPHGVDGQVRAQRLGGPPVGGRELLGSDAVERQDLDVVVAALADLLRDLGRALAGERGERAGVVGPQPVPGAGAEELVEVLLAELERGQISARSPASSPEWASSRTSSQKMVSVVGLEEVTGMVLAVSAFTS